jgi:hypothetical protein
MPLPKDNLRYQRDKFIDWQVANGLGTLCVRRTPVFDGKRWNAE